MPKPEITQAQTVSAVEQSVSLLDSIVEHGQVAKRTLLNRIAEAQRQVENPQTVAVMEEIGKPEGMSDAEWQAFVESDGWNLIERQVPCDGCGHYPCTGHLNHHRLEQEWVANK